MACVSVKMWHFIWFKLKYKPFPLKMWTFSWDSNHQHKRSTKERLETCMESLIENGKQSKVHMPLEIRKQLRERVIMTTSRTSTIKWPNWLSNMCILDIDWSLLTKHLFVETNDIWTYGIHWNYVNFFIKRPLAHLFTRVSPVQIQIKRRKQSKTDIGTARDLWTITFPLPVWQFELNIAYAYIGVYKLQFANSK